MSNTLSKLLNRITMNGALVGTGGAKGAARIGRLAGMLARAGDKVAANGALLGKGGTRVADAVRTALHNPLTGAAKRGLLPKYLASMPDADANKFIHTLFSLGTGRRGADPGLIADTLVDAGRYAAKSDTSFVSDLPDTLRRQLSEIHNGVNARASHGSPIRKSDLGDALRAPDAKDYDYRYNSLLMQLGRKGDKVNVAMKAGKPAVPIALGSDVHMAGQKFGDLFFIEAPVAAGNKDALALSVLAGQSKKPMGTLLAADMAEEMTRNPEWGWHVVGRASGPWYDVSGADISMPKVMVVNDAGKRYADEYMNLLNAQGMGVTPTDALDPQALSDIKANTAIGNKKLQWFKNYGPYAVHDPKQQLDRSQLGAVLGSGWYGMDSDRARRTASYFGIPDDKLDEFIADMTTENILTPRQYRYKDIAGAQTKHASFVKPYQLLRRLLGDANMRTLGNARKAFKASPVAAIKETMARTFIDAPGQTIIQGIQNPRSLISNKALYRSLRSAPGNSSKTPAEIADLIRKIRTNQVLAAGATLTGAGGLAALAGRGDADKT